MDSLNQRIRSGRLNRRDFSRLLILGGCSLVAGCGGDEKSDSLIDGEGKPSLEITGISSYQQSLDGESKISGRVSHVKPSESKIAVYLSVYGPSANDATHAWWPKPKFGNMFTEINGDGTWSTDFVSGGADYRARFFKVFLVPASIPDPYDVYGYYWAGADLPKELTSQALDVKDYDRGKNY